ncbi:MAG: branched-chain amino acid aminotransferase [Bacillota bacterium]|nr:branched-chain amino acid aminotransferase [Bacillota bacterium]
MGIKTDKIWMDGRLVDWEDAKVHVLTHALHYGSGVFEGIRAYETAGGPAVFRLKEHVDRLFASAKLLYMEVPYTHEEISEAIKETIRANNLKSCYIRPVVYRGLGEMGVNPAKCPVNVFVAVWPWGAYLGEEALAKGIRAKVTSWARNYISSFPAKGKVNGAYVNSILAKMDALQSGYDEAIFLDTDGYVAEGSGENIFWAKDGVIYTTPLPTVLKGITRASIMELARGLGYEVVEARAARDELYLADEVWFCGTAAEITPVREIDGHTIGEGRRGPIVEALQKRFFAVVHGEVREYEKWLARV